MPTDPYRYVTGTPPAQQSDVARFEFKRPDQTSRGGRGGGYPRWRSYESRPHTPRQGKEDVYVAVHRLAAVAWCFEDGMTAADILESEALVGTDVHHELRMPAANIEGELSLRDHGEHSEITQADRRAWAADQQRTLAHGANDDPTCPGCGDPLDDGGVTAANLSDPWCLSCATDHPDPGTIEL